MQPSQNIDETIAQAVDKAAERIKAENLESAYVFHFREFAAFPGFTFEGIYPVSEERAKSHGLNLLFVNLQVTTPRGNSLANYMILSKHESLTNDQLMALKLPY
jgi:hypothetical protein